MPLPLYQNCEEAAIIVFTLFKKKTRREEADRLPAFHLEGSRARTRVSWLGANSTSQQSARASASSANNLFAYQQTRKQVLNFFLMSISKYDAKIHSANNINMDGLEFAK